MNYIRLYAIPAFLIAIIIATGALLVPQVEEQITYSIEKAQFQSQQAAASKAISQKTKVPQEFTQAQNILSRIQQISALSATQPSAELSSQKRSLYKQLMAADPTLFNFIVEKEGKEQPTKISGTLRLVQMDSGDTHVHEELRYYVQTPERTYSLFPTAALKVAPGSYITVSGFVIDDQIVVKTNAVKSNISISKVAAPLESTGDQRTLVILVKNNSNDPEPMTPAHARELIFDGQFPRFMAEQSYGKVSFSGDVYGWYALNTSGVLRGCHLLTAEDMQQVIQRYAISISNYSRVVFLNNGASGACSDIGKSTYTINGQQYRFSMSSIGLQNYDQSSRYGSQPFPWTNLDYSLSHELAHGLGLQHAHGWDCGATSLATSCQHIDYGNYFDAMGTVGLALHFNAYYKELLGWIPSTKIQNITETGTYTVNALESGTAAQSKDVIAAKIKVLGSASSLTPYYIETRRGTGFDAQLARAELTKNQQGILVNKVITNEGPTFSRLLDLHPTDAGWYDDLKEQASLNKAVVATFMADPSNAKTFEDPIHGVTIGPIIESDADSTTFKVTLVPAPCVARDPNIFAVYGYPTIAANGRAELEVVFTNADYDTCEASAFHIHVRTPAGWMVAQGSDQLVTPDTQTSDYVEVYPTTATPGTYTITIDVTNTTSGLTTSYQKEIVVGDPLAIMRINPTAGPSNTLITIVGTGFDELTGRNSVVFKNIVTGASAVTESLPAGQGGITYTIPSTLKSCDLLSCTDVSTSAGTYQIQVIANGAIATASQNFQLGGVRPIDSETPLIVYPLNAPTAPISLPSPIDDSKK